MPPCTERTECEGAHDFVEADEETKIKWRMLENIHPQVKHFRPQVTEWDEMITC